MNAVTTDMRDFIEAQRISVPREMHPHAQMIVREYIDEISNHFEDTAHVVRLARMACAKIVSELRWEADKYTTVRDYREAWRLRHRADRFACVWGARA